MQLSEKLQTFFQIFIAFWESILNLKSTSISEVIDSGRRAYLNA